MKHDLCTHPSTPKGRAACRRAQGSIPEFVPAADKEALQTARDKIAARKHAGTATQQAIGEKNRAIGADMAKRKPIRKNNAQDRRIAMGTVGDRLDTVMSKRHAGVTKRDPDRIDTLARLRKVGAPEEWHSQIHHAWNQGWPVRYESSRDSDVQRLVIDAAKGIVQLVWSGDRRAYWFTPATTSVSRQCTSLPVVMAVAAGR